MQKFVDGHPDNVSVDDRHPRDAPVLGLGHDHSIDLFQILDSPLEDSDCEVANRRARFLKILEAEDDRPRIVACDVVLKQHLQCELTRFPR